MKNCIQYSRICFVLIAMVACNPTGSDESGNDSIPGVVKPPIDDSSAIKSTPPVNDSNVVNTDSLGNSR